MQHDPLKNFEIKMYFQKEPKFSGFYSRNNLPRTKDGEYIINLGEYKSIGTLWIALYVNANNIVYFDSFAVEHIPKEIKKFIKTIYYKFIKFIYCNKYL